MCKLQYKTIQVQFVITIFLSKQIIKTLQNNLRKKFNYELTQLFASFLVLQKQRPQVKHLIALANVRFMIPPMFIAFGQSYELLFALVATERRFTGM